MKTSFSVPCIEIIQKFIPDFNPDEPMFNVALSFENPPLLEQRANDNIEVFGIDGLLGSYMAEEKQIKIFIQGVQYVNNQLKIPSTDLYVIILMHELGHFYCHEFDIEKTRWDIKRYHETKSCVHEYLAQLFTYYCLKDSENWLASFLKLTGKQSIEYQRFNGSKDLPFESFKQLIKYLRLSNGMVDIYSIGDFLFTEYFFPIVTTICPGRYNDFRDFIREDLEKNWAYLGTKFGFFDEDGPRYGFEINILSCTSPNIDCMCGSMKKSFNESKLNRNLGR